MSKRGGLGRGLAALIPTSAPDDDQPPLSAAEDESAAQSADADVAPAAPAAPPVHLLPPAAQAAATVAQMAPGRFTLGVGSGEALNEHIFGDHWPPVSIRHERLEEALHIIRELWTGKIVTHEGKHFTVHDAKLWTLPDQAPEILVSGFGPKAVELAARIGDGFVTV